MAYFPEVLDRRTALTTLATLSTAATAALAGCGGATDTAAGPSPSPSTTSTGTPDTGSPPVDTGSPVDSATADAAPDTTFPTPGCMETADNIEGPYYRAAAPFRTDLRAGITKGVLLTLRGRVYGVGCKVPLTDAIVDIWQADSEGHYDNDGTLMVPPSDYRLRGRAKVDASGYFEVKTVIPGHYLNGAQYRPAHIHAKVSAAGHRLLTTQLYFEGDPYNGIDPFIKKPLIMKLEDVSGEKRATFDFVLAAV
jgi:protocatechuate 3,4-dioxygenase beta subunit